MIQQPIEMTAVIAPDATTADALSKVVSILIPEKSFPIVKRYRAAARVLRMPEDRIEAFETEEFRRHDDVDAIRLKPAPLHRTKPC